MTDLEEYIRTYPTLNHVAGPLIDNVQQCSRCGKVLVKAKKKGPAPTAFAVGQVVSVDRHDKVEGVRNINAEYCATPMSPVR